MTLLPVTTQFGTPLGHQAFGSSATNGQILDTTAETAVAKSQWSAATGFEGGSTGVTFSRQFLLSGAPEGWTVSLNGILNGSLFASGINSADLTAAASIAPSLGITFHEERPTSTGPPFFIPVNQSRLQTAVLPNGSYIVTGSLVTGAGGGNSVSASGAEFSVTVTATPLAEPSALLLLATGLAGAVWRYRRRAAEE